MIYERLARIMNDQWRCIVCEVYGMMVCARCCLMWNEWMGWSLVLLRKSGVNYAILFERGVLCVVNVVSARFVRF